MDFAEIVNGHCLEFIESSHTYLVDGVIVPSITQIVRRADPNKYSDIPPGILRAAAEKGVEVHSAIERWYKDGVTTDLPELRGMIELQLQYKFNVVAVEVPVILHSLEEPIAAGRLDMVLEVDNKLWGADIKRTARLDIPYLTRQLNLYRIAYRQCYRREWTELKGIHLRGDIHEIVDIPVDEAEAWALIGGEENE